MLIDGARVGAADGQMFEGINPANGEVWSRLPEATAADVNRAFNHGPWAAMSPMRFLWTLPARKL